MAMQKHIEAFTKILGPKGVTVEASALAPHLEEWRSKYTGKTDAMLMPASTEECARAVQYANENKIALVPQGGNTGLVGGGIPGLENNHEILFSTKRLNKNINVDYENYSLTADAGCTVASLQNEAEAKGLLFPLSLASEGSCTAGGIVSTNAGGVHVLRYGTARALTLGLEAVLPNGDIVSDLSALRKNNTGYNLSQLLVGAEGTLGIVTRAAFKLFPAELERHTYWLAVKSPQDALQLLASVRKESGDRVSIFEILPHVGLELVLKHIPGTTNPLSTHAAWYVLVEVATSTPDANLGPALDSWIETSLEQDLLIDGAKAQSDTQREAFWKLRESMSEAQKLEGGSIKHDISVPVSSIPAFIEEGTEALEKSYKGCRVTPFGHLGDGNLHFNVLQPVDMDKQRFLDQWDGMNRLAHDIVIKYGGSISAEHGIGTMKRAELARLKNPAEVAAMRAIKQALDPNNIMNPGVLFL